MVMIIFNQYSSVLYSKKMKRNKKKKTYCDIKIEEHAHDSQKTPKKNVIYKNDTDF